MAPLPRSITVSVIFPAYQEEEYLPIAVREVIEGLRKKFDSFEVIVVENGSRDRTAEVAKELATKYPEMVSTAISSADYGKALREGLMIATKDYVVNFDVDLYDLEFLERAVSRISEPNGPSIVVASKRGDGANDTRHWTRKVVTGVFSTLLRLGFGLKVSDTHGMKAMRRADVRPLAEKCLFGTDLFDTELVLRTERAGFRTSEIGVTIIEKRPARTPIAGRIFRSVRGLGVLWLALRKEQRILKK